MYRVVWLLPQPVRTAHTATTGTRAASIVASGPEQDEVRPGREDLGSPCASRTRG